MDWLTFSVGAAALVFGIVTTCMRFTSPHKFAKLQAMKQKFGNAAGTIVHTVFYSVIPIVFGIVCIVRGSQGESLFLAAEGHAPLVSRLNAPANGFALFT